MVTQPLPSLLGPAHRFAGMIDYLCRFLAVQGPKRYVAAPLIDLVWVRLKRMVARFARLAERVRAGRVAVVAPARSRVAAPRPEGEPRPEYVLSGRFGWLVHMVPEAAEYGVDVSWMLGLPEMKELFAAAPQMGRIVRPLCRMLGIETPAELRLPPRERARKARDPSARGPARWWRWNDDGCWPQWRGPGGLWETEEEFWKFHPPPRGYRRKSG